MDKKGHWAPNFLATNHNKPKTTPVTGKTKSNRVFAQRAYEAPQDSLYHWYRTWYVLLGLVRTTGSEQKYCIVDKGNRMDHFLEVPVSA